MTQPLNLALTLSLNDRLIGPLQRSFADARRAFESIERDLANVARVGTKAGDALGQLSQKGRDAGNGLRAVGREAEQAEGRISRLHRAMDGLSSLTMKGGAIFGAYSAGKHILQAPMERAAAYELDLAKLSNVLYNDRRTVSGRQAGQVELDAAVRRTTAQGVTRDQALSGLRFVGAAGGIDRADAMAMLPTLAKFSVAGEAGMEDVAGVAVKAMKGFGIQPGQMPRVLEMALISGQMGNFEFRDMAKWLPQQMAMAKGMLGMSGVADFGTLLAINQIASGTAGSNAEAGNNILNLLGKLNSNDTASDFKKANIDLAGSMTKARATGTSQVDAFFNLLEGEFVKNKGYAELQTKLKGARAAGNKAGEVETLEAMQGILAGSVIGKFLQDRQALMPAIGILNDRGGIARLKSEGEARLGEVDLAQAVLMSTSAMKNTLADSAEQARQFDALRGLTEAFADSRVKVAALSLEYPEAAKWVERMSMAAQVAAVSLGALGLANLVGKGVPALVAGGALTSGAAGAVGFGSALGGAATFGLAGAAGVGLAGLGGYGLGTLIQQDIEQNSPETWDKIVEGMGFLVRAMDRLGNVMEDGTVRAVRAEWGRESRRD